jgi:hypothetical protein
MEEEVLHMSAKEVERLRVLEGVRKKHLTQVKAAELLNISDRQVRNLLALTTSKGPKGLISKKRGAPSNHTKPQALRDEVLTLIREKYVDFGPTLAREKLAECHKLEISIETLRKWMTQTHLWVPKQRRKKIHPLRERRLCFGELIQIDGSHEFWFEIRGEWCVVIVFVDDSTSKITSLYFSKGESLDAYFKALEKHLKRYGKPVSLYSDHFSVFDSPVEGNLTQFKKALKTLDIDLLLANSPQAKGRVERANRTLQDRLIKEMRLRKINTIEEANKYADEFVEIYNQKFSKEPASPFDAHRPLGTQVDLTRILTRYEERTLSKDAIFQFHNRFYKIMEEASGRNLCSRKIEVRLGLSGAIRAFIDNMELKVAPLETIRQSHVPLLSPSEDYGHERKRWVPSAAHPWKHRLYEKACA